MMMTNVQKEQLISAYVEAYNAKHVEGMLANLANNMVFENHSNGEISMRLEGMEAFRQQAEQAATLFTEREQRITGFTHSDDHTEIGIAYRATLAVDLPNGMKQGDVLQLQGKSVFRFAEHRIMEITDVTT
jgi:ketosteroid isomerase-like protein